MSRKVKSSQKESPDIAARASCATGPDEHCIVFYSSDPFVLAIVEGARSYLPVGLLRYL
jgi:hypothetical protein